MTVPKLITDIHAHVLPCLDDGPDCMHNTIELLQAMRDANTHRVFCTPHYHHPHFRVSATEMDRAFRRVQILQRAVLLRPHVDLGAEVRLNTCLVDDIKCNRIPTLGQTLYVLVEFDALCISDLALRLIYELRLRGFFPIMAHPERNVAIQRDERWIGILRAEGVLMQATAACYAVPNKGHNRASKLAWKLLRQGHIDLIASDAHNMHTRPSLLHAAYDQIASTVGERVADTLIDNANAVWENGTCQPVSLPIKAARRLWPIFRLMKSPKHDPARS